MTGYLLAVVIVALARPDELARIWAADRKDQRARTAKAGQQ